jgi:2-phosphoglycerate kinase
MEGYVKHQFHAHPHVASVITRHLAANFIKPDASSQAAMETKVTALSTKVDSYVSKVELLITKEKERAAAAKEKRKRANLKRRHPNPAFSAGADPCTGPHRSSYTQDE